MADLKPIPIAPHVATQDSENAYTEDVAARIPNQSVSFVSSNGVYISNPTINIGANVGSIARIFVVHQFDVGAYGTIERTELKVGATAIFKLSPGWNDVTPGSYTEHKVIGTVTSSDGNKGMYSIIRYKKP